MTEINVPYQIGKRPEDEWDGTFRDLDPEAGEEYEPTREAVEAVGAILGMSTAVCRFL